MNKVRAILIAVIAVSVAILPVAGAKFGALLPGTSSLIAQSDCCPQGKDCDPKDNGVCGKSAACAAKCSSLSASVLAESGEMPLPSPSERSIHVGEIAASPSHNPPLPPPRV